LDEHFQLGADFAKQLDQLDELAAFRDEFVFGDENLIYMDGNSLGRLPRRAAEHLRNVVEQQWAVDLIRGWNQGWYQAPARVGDKIALLIGAGPEQVIVSDSTSVNLFKLAIAALQLRPARNRIVSDVLNFPSDLYVLQGCMRLMDAAVGPAQKYHLDLVTSQDGISVDPQALFAAIDEQTALVTLSHVTFKSGFLHDVAAITAQAHRAGALVLLDLSHSVGVVPIELDVWNTDMAVGCTYKYLNGGPGAPAFLYVRHDLQDQVRSPIQGWFGQRSPFAFDLKYEPAAGIPRFLAGTPAVLSLLAMEAGLDIHFRAGIEHIRTKSTNLSAYLIFLVDEILAPLGFILGTPRDPRHRGSHVTIQHREGYRINRALIEEMNVLPDFREPDNLRLGLAPLYTSFYEVWEAVDRIRRVVEEKMYHRYPSERLPVT
jgi:kynureninase